MKEDMAEKFLTGNSFPINLIRRRVEIIPETLSHYRERLSEGCWASYWGHGNTLSIAHDVCGYDLTPQSERPALTLDSEGYPQLYGERYRECWVLSPEYRQGFRPALKSEVSPEEILSWQILKIIWV